MPGVVRAIQEHLSPIGAALVMLLVPGCLLTLAVQRGPDCTAGTRFPWAGPAFVAVALTAVCLTIIAWLAPGWRQRHLAHGATIGLALLIVTTLLVVGGLDYQASKRC